MKIAHLCLMVHISFPFKKKFNNLTMAITTCNIQCCLTILYM